jgi:hypothetical protein
VPAPEVDKHVSSDDPHTSTYHVPKTGTSAIGTGEL